jgi:hypothetical protein
MEDSIDLLTLFAGRLFAGEGPLIPSTGGNEGDAGDRCAHCDPPAPFRRAAIVREHWLPKGLTDMLRPDFIQCGLRRVMEERGLGTTRQIVRSRPKDTDLRNSPGEIRTGEATGMSTDLQRYEPIGWHPIWRACKQWGTDDGTTQQSHRWVARDRWPSDLGFQRCPNAGRLIRSSRCWRRHSWCG